MLISIYLFNVQKIQAQRKSTKPGWVNADFFHGLPLVEPHIYRDQIGLLYIRKYIVLFFLSLYNTFAEIRWLRFKGETQSLAGWMLISFMDLLIRSSYNRTAYETWGPLYSKVHGVLGLLWLCFFPSILINIWVLRFNLLFLSLYNCLFMIVFIKLSLYDCLYIIVFL